MARFFNDKENAIKQSMEIRRAFADLLFAELSKSDKNASFALAAHLGIDVEDVEEWLRGESLPCRELNARLITLMRGDSYLGTRATPDANGGHIKSSTWADVTEFIQEAENIQVLMGVKLTRGQK